MLRFLKMVSVGGNAPFCIILQIFTNPGWVAMLRFPVRFCPFFAFLNGNAPFF